jgi:endonuclease/exonuclease/phosphatase family metal-dependent hydrolase
MSLNPFLHTKQIDLLLRQLPAYPYPAVLMGDFNMKPGSKGWRKMTDTFQDVWLEAGTGPGHTYPSHRPRLRLDYIFATRDVQAVDARVENDMANASDHLPLSANLQYP